MAVSTISDLNSLFNEIFEDSMFIVREQNIMTMLVRTFSAMGWQDRKFSIRPEVTAVTVGEGVDFSGATTWGKTLLATFTPAEIIDQVILTDRQIDTDPDSARQDAAFEMGNAITTKIDVDLCSTFDDFTTDKGAGAGSAATISSAAAAISVLRNKKIPNPLYAVWHPYHWHNLDCALAA